KGGQERTSNSVFCPADNGGSKHSTLTGEYIKFCPKGMEYIGCQVGSRYKIPSIFCLRPSAAK
ncbi:MAG: hypothetical protein NTX75_18005, partial [Proteobacteria bacterium]|nr:hypothetical protein [Pseudomonadota bacterium]